MLIVYVSSVCPNSNRFLEGLRRVPSLRGKAKIINVDQVPPSMRQGVEFVPTVVENGGNVYVGAQAFEFLKQFDLEMELEPMDFGGGDFLAFSTIDSSGGEARQTGHVIANLVAQSLANQARKNSSLYPLASHISTPVLRKAPNAYRQILRNRRSSEAATKRLFRSVRMGNVNDVRRELAAGARVDVPIDGHYFTPLHMSARMGTRNITKALLEKANVNSKDVLGQTALHHAVLFDGLGTVSDLLDAKARHDVADEEGKQPIHLATNPAIIRKLLAAGANLRARTKLGKTPLHLAAARGGGGGVGRLIEAGSNVHARDNRGRTPLHYAYVNHGASNGHAVQRLVAANAKIDARDNQGRTPIMVALESNRRISPFIAAGANVSARDKDGRTALHIAAQMAEPYAVVQLIRAGANVHAKNKNGRTPLNLAKAVNGNKGLLGATTALILRQHGATN